MFAASQWVDSSETDFGKSKPRFMAYLMDPVRRKGRISLAGKEMRE